MGSPRRGEAKSRPPMARQSAGSGNFGRSDFESCNQSSLLEGPDRLLFRNHQGKLLGDLWKGASHFRNLGRLREA